MTPTAQQPNSPTASNSVRYNCSRILILTVLLTTLQFACETEVLQDHPFKSNQPIENPHQAYLDQKAYGFQFRTTMYSIQDALRYLNDGMNYLYCRPDDYYLATEIALDTFLLAVDGSNEVEEEDLVELMDSIAYWAGDIFHSDGRDLKEPFIFHHVQNANPSNGYVPVAVYFAYEAGAELNTEDAYPYEDSWIYGQWGLDVSDECSVEEANADAADLFRRDLRREIVFRDKFSTYCFRDPYVYCYTSLSNSCIAEEIPPQYFPVDEDYQDSDMLNANDLTPWDNINDYLLFKNYSGYSNYSVCLEDDEMNFYFDEMQGIAEGVLPSPQGNAVIIQVEVGYEHLGFINTTIGHSMLVVKATKVIIDIEEDEDPLILPGCCP